MPVSSAPPVCDDLYTVVKKLPSICTTLALIGTVAFMPTAGSLYGQNQHAFDSLEIGLQYVTNTNRNVFHEFWEPGNGVVGWLGVPFYYGDVRAGIQLLPYAGKGKGISDFQSSFIYLGWSIRWALPYRFDWFNGLSVGSTIMTFDSAEGYTRNESELGVTLTSSLRYFVKPRWAFRLSSDYHTIFTNKPIKLTFISVGLSYTLATPSWMKTFLK